MATIHPYVPTHDKENIERWGWLFELTREVFPPGFVPPPSWVAPNRLNRPDYIEKAFAEAGFQHIRTKQEETTLFFADEVDWWAWEWSQGSRFWVEGMSPEALATFKAKSFEKLNEMKEPDGIRMLAAALFAIAQSPE